MWSHDITRSAERSARFKTLPVPSKGTSITHKNMTILDIETFVVPLIKPNRRASDKTKSACTAQRSALARKGVRKVKGGTRTFEDDRVIGRMSVMGTWLHKNAAKELRTSVEQADSSQRQRVENKSN